MRPPVFKSVYITKSKTVKNDDQDECTYTEVKIDAPILASKSYSKPKRKTVSVVKPTVVPIPSSRPTVDQNIAKPKRKSTKMAKMRLSDTPIPEDIEDDVEILEAHGYTYRATYSFGSMEYHHVKSPLQFDCYVISDQTNHNVFNSESYDDVLDQSQVAEIFHLTNDGCAGTLIRFEKFVVVIIKGKSYSYILSSDEYYKMTFYPIITMSDIKHHTKEILLQCRYHMSSLNNYGYESSASKLDQACNEAIELIESIDELAISFSVKLDDTYEKRMNLLNDIIENEGLELDREKRHLYKLNDESVRLLSKQWELMVEMKKFKESIKAILSD